MELAHAWFMYVDVSMVCGSGLMSTSKRSCSTQQGELHVGLLCCDSISLFHAARELVVLKMPAL